MRFDVLTIFPEIFLSGYLSTGILGKAITKGLLKVHVVNIRDFADDPHKSTDDRPYGGGEGMVMKPEPIFKALESVERNEEKSLTILLSPQGERFHQHLAWELCGYDQLVLVCGRYEGVDERVKELCIDREISIGDYVLTGGELPALVLMDAVARLIPGVLGNDCSAREDSFQGGLLEYPHYTRPRVFRGREVPKVLLSGDHERIRQWRRRQSLKRTLERRPDLLDGAALTAEDKALLHELKAEKASMDEES